MHSHVSFRIQIRSSNQEQMKTILVIHFVLVVLLRSSLGNLRPVCGTSDSYWEVYKNKQNNTFTCTGLLAQDTVQWHHWEPNTGVSANLGECPPLTTDGSQPVCKRPLDPILIPSRVSDGASVMLINPLINPSNTKLFEKGRLVCTAVRQMLPAETAGCRLDYIYAGDNISCTIQFRNDTWSVFGQCSTERVYSAQNRYRCEWIQIKESTREEILIANTSMTVVTNVSRWCNMTSYLPPVGQYTYRVTLVPGEVTVSASFDGNNTIRRPSSKPSHNCPQYVTEGDDLNCTCSVSDLGSPPGVLQWNTTTSAELRFSAVQPREPETHSCQLLWNKTIVQSVQYTLTVAYKPPVISLEPPHNPGEPVYQGDNFTMTCTVHGGKPVTATSIRFTCPHMTNTSDSTGTAEVSSILRFYSVSSDNHGNCTCRAVGINTTWYTQTAEWSLIVYTPPSAPIIFPLPETTGRALYPYMAGTSGTLCCKSNQTGRPETTYTWPGAATGHPSGSNLTFYSLSREDNGKTIKCRVSNSYTENRQPVNDASFALQVYYEPIISFTHLSDGISCAEVSSVRSYCIVAEGQRVDINCTADSNPAPALFTWVNPHKDVYSNTGELVIASTNHTVHNGDYNCTVITKQVDTDSRLPLMSSAILTVVVGYSPSVLAFRINNMSAIAVNIPERSRVDMKCLCSGRPIPSIRLINSADPEQLLNQSLPTGDIFVDEQTREVVFTIDHVPCEASGFYKCDVNNSLGQDSQSRILLVSCAPRKTFSDGQPLTVSVTNGTGELRVRMTAYPTPVLKVLTYLGPNETSGGHPVKENIIFVECSSNFLAPAAVICSISVINVTQNDEGFYKIVFSNSFGELSFSFFVKQAMLEDHQTKPDENVVAVVVLAVLFSVLLVVLVVVVIWVWRRGWTLPCADVSNQRLTQQIQSGDPSDEDLFPVTTNTSLTKEGGATSFYDSLQMEDVGKRPQYEEVQRYQNASTIQPYEGESDKKQKVRGDHTYVN